MNLEEGKEEEEEDEKEDEEEEQVEQNGDVMDVMNMEEEVSVDPGQRSAGTTLEPPPSSSNHSPC